MYLGGDVYTSGSSTDYYKQTQATGTTYSLEEGVNLLKMQGPGQLFVMYNVDGEELLNNPAPIKIHIPLGHGVVNGSSIWKNTRQMLNMQN